jgi:hypothetical protein
MVQILTLTAMVAAIIAHTLMKTLTLQAIILQKAKIEISTIITTQATIPANIETHTLTTLTMAILEKVNLIIWVTNLKMINGDPIYLHLPQIIQVNTFQKIKLEPLMVIEIKVEHRLLRVQISSNLGQ